MRDAGVGPVDVVAHKRDAIHRKPAPISSARKSDALGKDIYMSWLCSPLYSVTTHTTNSYGVSERQEAHDSPGGVR